MAPQRPVPGESLDAIVAVLELVRRGRAHSRSELIERTGLSRAVVTQLANFFNPSLIVIGGGVARAGDAYLATIRQVIYARSTALATRELLVQLSQLGNRAGVIGGASMVLDELFSAPQLARWIDDGRPASLVEVAA